MSLFCVAAGILMPNHRLRRLWIAVGLVTIAGCGGRNQGSVTGSTRRVVVYSSLDRVFAAPALKAYAKQPGVEVLPKFNVERTKTVGLS